MFCFPIFLGKNSKFSTKHDFFRNEVNDFVKLMESIKLMDTQLNIYTKIKF